MTCLSALMFLSCLALGSCVAPSAKASFISVDSSGVLRQEDPPTGKAAGSTAAAATVRPHIGKKFFPNEPPPPRNLPHNKGESYIQKEDAKVLNPKDLATYPKDLHDLGIKIFGSEKELESFVQGLDDPQKVEDDGIVLRMVQSHGDNSVARLNAEMVGNDQYGIRKVDAKNGLIIDIGGNIGDMAITAALVHPHLKVLALEPVPSTYFINRLNMHLNNVKELPEEDFGVPGKSGLLALNKALTKDGRPVEITYDIHSTQDAVTNTNNDNPLMGVWSHAKVPSVELSKYVESNKAGPVRLLKMDCEGCEFEAIPAMRGWFDDKTKVERFTAEIHRSVQDKSIDKIRAAGKATNDELSQTDELLSSRGCEVGPKAWKVDC